jgi:flagellar biosynthesis chaperone FliJ
MAAFTYRLQTLLDQKEELKKQAERELVALEEDLKQQTARMEALQKTVQELTEKRNLMRRDLLSKPGQGMALNAQKVQERMEYAKAVGFQIEDAQTDVITQRGVIEQCESDVQQGKNRVQEANREVEVLQKHRAKQEERFRRELQVREELMLDEIGNVLYTNRSRSL